VFVNNNIVCKTIQQSLILNSEIQEQTIIPLNRPSLTN